MPDFETLKADWLSYREAVNHLVEKAALTEAEVVDADQALGRYLATPVVAGTRLPAWDNSGMDGYAVRDEDLGDKELPLTLNVVGEALPGSVPLPILQPGEAVRIMTGGPVPAGCKTVIRVEHTDAESSPGLVQVDSAADLGRNVRPAAEDMAEGDVVIEAGSLVTPGALAVALSAGASSLTVRKRCRVGVLSSGDELVPPSRFDEVREGRGIPETNGPTLLAALADLGCDAIPLGVVGDDEEAIRERLRSLPDLDLLVTTGGASMGAKDLFKRTLLGEGLALDFWRVRIRPGSPASFGTLPTASGPLPVLGLPGNPASAFVTFYILAGPYVRSAMGASVPDLPKIPARAGSGFKSPEGLTHFYRVRLRLDADGLVAEPTGPQGSGLVRSLADADGLLIVEEGRTEVAVGEPAWVVLLPGYSGWDAPLRA